MNKEMTCKCSHCNGMFEGSEARWLQDIHQFACYFCGSTEIYQVKKCAECYEYVRSTELKRFVSHNEEFLCEECGEIEKYLVNNRISRKEFKQRCIKFVDSLEKDKQIEALNAQIELLKDNSILDKTKRWITFIVNNITKNEVRAYQDILNYIESLEERQSQKKKD